MHISMLSPKTLLAWFCTDPGLASIRLSKKVF